MDTPQSYIVARLAELRGPSSPVSFASLAETLFAQITTKKFRKYALPAGYAEQLRALIEKAITTQQPLTFVWVFGGYKLWSLPQAPEVDWAELFSLVYFAHWLKPVAALHKPGVVFDFFSDAAIIPLLNQVSVKDTMAYEASFRSLLEFITPFLPEGFNFQFHRVIDQYASSDEFTQELDHNIAQLTKERGAHFQLTSAQIAAIDLNVRVTQTQKDDPAWRQKVQIIHDAYSLATKRRPYYRTPEKVMVVNVPLSGAIAVGTTKSSVAKFWVGAGALKKNKDSFQETVLSPTQLQHSSLQTVPVKIPHLEGKNFQQISIAE